MSESPEQIRRDCERSLIVSRERRRTLPGRFLAKWLTPIEILVIVTGTVVTFAVIFVAIAVALEQFHL